MRRLRLTVASAGGCCVVIAPCVQFLQTPHPPARKYKGRIPRVHQGFLATWHAHGVYDAVLALVGDLLSAAPTPGAVRVLCTGHSLGGAVAQLASFDIVRELGLCPDRVSVYTFGCPRIGNHALAEEFEEVVPDTWHIINDQDVVTRGMKVRPQHAPLVREERVCMHGMHAISTAPVGRRCALAGRRARV